MKFISAHLFKKSQGSAGFTLIELLVVIGILGILATALVATIDPFEQLKKAQDANVKNTAVEYVDANIRYYTTNNALPWGSQDAPYGTACGTTVGATTGPTSTVILNNLASNCIAELINQGELKGAFTSAAGVLDSIILTGTTNSVTACFSPQSRAQKSDTNTKFKLSGGNQFTVAPTSQCPNATATDCYWCAQ